MLKENAKWHKNKKSSIMCEFIVPMADVKVQETINFIHEEVQAAL